MNYDNERALNMLGIESWRNLSQAKFFGFLDALPDMDGEVALQIVRALPEFTTYARAALDDAAKAYDGLLAANAESMAAVNEVDRIVLETLREELAKDDLSSEQRMRVLELLCEARDRAHLKDEQNKAFVAAQFDKRLAAGVVVATSIAAVLLKAATSGTRTGGVLRALKAA